MAFLHFMNAAKSFGIIGFLQILLSRLMLRVLNKLDRHTIKNYEVLFSIIRQGTPIVSKKETIKLSYLINNNEHKFSLIKRGSDLQVFNQLILKKEYFEAIDLIKSNGINPISMLDAGANIGLATIYFKAFFPNLKVLAVEPSQQVYERMRHHILINKLKNVSSFNGAVWSKNTNLELDTSFRDKQDWSIRTISKKGKGAEIEALSIPSLMTRMNLQTLDILKMDIEGAESEIFANIETVEEWLSKVKCLIVEIHDEFNCREQILETLKSFNYKLFDTHEYTVAINRQYIRK